MEQTQFGARSRAASSASSDTPSAFETSQPAPLPSSSSFPSSFPSPSPTQPSSAPSSDTPEPHSHTRTQSTLLARYQAFLHLAPGVQALIGEDAELIAVDDDSENEGTEAPLVRSASDFSYSSEEYGGKGWRIAGDAGGELQHALATRAS